MKIQYVGMFNPSFTSERRKFDVQGHVGSTYDGILNSDVCYSPKNIVDTVEVNNVKKVLVSSLSSLNPKGGKFFHTEADGAEELLKVSKSDKVELLPLISCQPGISQDISVVEKLINQNKFYGMKFHPTMTQKSVKDNFDLYSEYISLAENKGLPCVFHSSTDGFSDPAEIVKLAENHPKHPIVLYHIDLMSSPNQVEKSIDLIADSVNSSKSNLFVDISWLTGFGDNAKQNENIINKVLEKIGPNRILFGSDTPISEMGDKNKYGAFTDFVENTIKNFYKGDEKEAELALNKIFYDNAEELFVNKRWFLENAKEQMKGWSNKNIIMTCGLALAGILLITGLVLTGKNRKKYDDHASNVVKG